MMKMLMIVEEKPQMLVPRICGRGDRCETKDRQKGNSDADGRELGTDGRNGDFFGVKRRAFLERQLLTDDQGQGENGYEKKRHAVEDHLAGMVDRRSAKEENPVVISYFTCDIWVVWEEGFISEEPEFDQKDDSRSHDE